MKFTTGLVRLSYAHLTEPAENLNGVMQYSASLIIPKDNKKSVQQFENAIRTMMGDKECIAKWGGKNTGIKSPLHDGDTERPEDANYANSYYVNVKANTDHRPKLYNKDLTEIVDPSDIYSGCYGQAVLSVYAYNYQGSSKGLSFSILSFRKVKDGAPLGGVSVSENDFDDDLLDGFDDDTASLL